MTKAHLWALVELDSAVLRQSDWMAGGSVEATLLGADGTAVASQSKDMPARRAAVAVDMGEVDAPDGEVTVRTRITPKNGGLPYTDTIRLGKVESPGRADPAASRPLHGSQATSRRRTRSSSGPSACAWIWP